MRRSLVFTSAVLLFALAAGAQDYPKMETFLGYTYVRANSVTDGPSFSANGGGGQFVYNFNRWIGAVADLGAVHNGNIAPVHLDSTMLNFLFGPRICFRFKRLSPYFQILWGGVFAASSTGILAIPVLGPNPSPSSLNPANAIETRITANQTAFAMTVGGGLDFKINKHVSFRPIGLDYYLTRLQDFRTARDNSQNNLRYTTGLNFTFGAR